MAEFEDEDNQEEQPEEEENGFGFEDFETEAVGDDLEEEEPVLPQEEEVSDDETLPDIVVVPKPKKTIRPMRPAVLSPYETAAILNARANEIANNAPIYIKIDPRRTLGAMAIAQEELKQRKIPYLIARPRPDGRKDYISVADMKTRLDK